MSLKEMKRIPLPWEVGTDRERIPMRKISSTLKFKQSITKKDSWALIGPSFQIGLWNPSQRVVRNLRLLKMEAVNEKIKL
jgi:hypothetical protein